MSQPENNFQATQKEEIMSIGQWLLTTFVMAIPLVGLIMIFVWGFGQGNKNRANYCKAMLVWCAVGIALSFMFGAAIFGALASLSGAFS